MEPQQETHGELVEDRHRLGPTATTQLGSNSRRARNCLGDQLAAKPFGSRSWHVHRRCTNGEAMSRGRAGATILWLVVGSLVAYFVGSLLTARLSG